jgi:hypothetical protein
VTLLLLALLLTAIYGYWYLTNDARIRRQARRYLKDITGAQVRLDHASFNLFGDIRLDGVQLRVPGDPGADPFFSAKSVILKHNPWSVFFGGRIKPTEVISLDAMVADTPKTRAFLKARAPSRPGRIGPMDLPVIRVDSCRFQRTTVTDGLKRAEEELDLEVNMTPLDQIAYDISIKHRKKEVIVQEYNIQLQLSPDVKWKILSGEGDLVAATDILLPEYRQWLDAYQIKGRHSFEGEIIVSKNALKGDLPLQLKDVAFKLPNAQGGLSLTDVFGTLIFTPPDKTRTDELKNGRIQLKDFRGKLAEAGGASVKLSGQYLGYRADSPFSVKLEIDQMAIPQDSPNPALSKILKRIHREYSPVGKARMIVSMSRDAGGKDLSVNGTLWPLGMSATHRWVPYRVDNLRGQLHFDTKRVVLKDVTCQRQGGSFTINAVAPLHRNAETGKWGWSARIDADSASLTPELQKALPKRAFVGKAYRLRNIQGTVHVREGRIWVDQDRPLRSRGPKNMRCNALYGQVMWDKKSSQVDVYVEADDVPIDQELLDTLSPGGRKAIELLSAKGSVRKLSLALHQKTGEKFKYEVTAGLDARDKVSVTYKGFPYSLTGISGDVTVNQDDITLAGITGRHKDTPIALQGKLYPGSDKVGVELQIEARQLVFDKELHQALPTAIKGIWDSLVPSGHADVTLALNQNLPASNDKPEYHLEIRPKSMSVTYDGFPYQFGGITGLVIAEPKAITLRKLTCEQGYQLDGDILQNGRQMKLKIKATGLPVDKKLLAALPDEFNAAMKTIKPGAVLDLDIKDLTIVRGPSESPATRPTGATVSATTKPAALGVLSWLAKGDLRLHDTIVDVAFGTKKLNGTLGGSIGSDRRGLWMNVKADLERIKVSGHEITKVKGKVTKKPGSPLVRVEDLQARVYGGRLAGREVMVRLGDKPKYAFSLFYQDVSLGALVNATVSDPKKRSGVKGRLEGKISMEAVAGDPKSRRAAGTVVISKGKLYKMPIMLGLMHVLYLSLPGDSAFTDGRLKYFVQGDTMVIEEIFLTGSALSLVGSGRISLDSEELDLTFLTGPPGRMPRIAVIRNASKVLNAIFKELLVIRITGTLSKPIRKALPLRSLDAILKELLSPGRAKKK